MDTSRPQIAICGISLLQATLTRFEPDLIISITDPHSPVRDEADRVLDGTDIPSVRLSFHDSHYSAHAAQLVGFDDFEAVAQALDTHTPQDAPKILVHCHAGTQRSPAMALFALGYIAQRTAPLDAATAGAIVNQVFTIVPRAEPNDRVVLMGGDVLEDMGLLKRALMARSAPAKAAPKKGGKLRKRAFRV